MNLTDYINSSRRGKDAHSLEKEAMRDPFLQDALDGFDAVDDDHAARLAAIRRGVGRVAAKEKKTVHLIRQVAVAGLVLLIALVGKELFTSPINSGLQAQNIIERPMDIYVPQAFYDENIAVIASINTELTKDLSVVAGKPQQSADSGADASLGVVVSVDESAQPLDIYVPAR